MMKHRHRDGMGRPFTPHCTIQADEQSEAAGGGGPREREFGQGLRHNRGGQRRGGRLFDYGEMRLLVLALIAEQPAHGYELIKAIEERCGGSYTPSPGVIYPTLAWLVDMGFATASAEASGRKNYSITAEGEAYLAARKDAANGLLTRGGPEAAGRHGVPLPIVRAMENLKTAMRLRMRAGNIDEQTIENIAAAIDAAAAQVEKSQ